MTPTIFLSYASQDADAAHRICDALRAAGLEVWFGQSELRGGDAWDASIRKQIKECALFVPIRGSTPEPPKNLPENTACPISGHFSYPIVFSALAAKSGVPTHSPRSRQWPRDTMNTRI